MRFACGLPVVRDTHGFLYTGRVIDISNGHVPPSKIVIVRLMKEIPGVSRTSRANRTGIPCRGRDRARGHGHDQDGDRDQD